MLTISILLQTMFNSNATKEEMLSMQHNFPVVIAGFLALVPYPLGEHNAIDRATRARANLLHTMETIVNRFKVRGEEGKGKVNLLEGSINAEENGKGLTHQDLLNYLLMFGLGGFDTTAAVMGSFIALLFSPGGESHLTRLRTEVKEHVPCGELDVDELKNLHG